MVLGTDLKVSLKDLRLGNYISITHKHYRFKQIYRYVKSYPDFFQPIFKTLSIFNEEKIQCIDIYENHEITVLEEQIRGICLTPEILLKCGFERFKKEGLTGWGYENNKLLLEAREGRFHFISHNINCSFSYLHQLQNLYEILLGKDLVINF